MPVAFWVSSAGDVRFDRRVIFAVVIRDWDFRLVFLSLWYSIWWLRRDLPVCLIIDALSFLQRDILLLSILSRHALGPRLGVSLLDVGLFFVAAWDGRGPVVDELFGPGEPAQVVLVLESFGGWAHLRLIFDTLRSWSSCRFIVHSQLGFLVFHAGLIINSLNQEKIWSKLRNKEWKSTDQN